VTRRRVPATGPTERRAVGNTLLPEVRRWLDQLSRCEAEVLAMRYGLVDNVPRTTNEIAQAYGFRPSTIRVYQANAMAKLRELVDPDVRVEHIFSRVSTVRRAAAYGVPVPKSESRLLHCDRHGWLEMFPRMDCWPTCKSCPCPVERSYASKPVQYCSDACRQAAYRARKKQRRKRPSA
jgi:hypothetical protein